MMSVLISLPWFARGDLRQRAQQIATVFARHGLGWITAQFGLSRGRPPDATRGMRVPSDRARVRQAQHLRQALEELGGTFIKLGQAISTRTDIIPKEYADELAKLQDAAPSVPLQDILTVMRTELQQSPDELFADFELEPLASASIGQVHAARLKSGDEVVVKVQRPGIAEQIEKDLLILTGMAEWAEGHSAILRDYRITSLVDEFAYTIRSELDYRAEGRNADLFRYNFADEPALTVPRVYWQYTTSRVLTMERVRGIKITDIEALDRAGIDRRRVAENAVRLMLREAFEFGLFHADPHAGNFFVRPDAGIALMDFGMVGRLTPRVQEILLEIGLALVHRDAERLTDDLYALGIATNTAKRHSLQRDVDHMLTHYTTGSLQELAATQMVNDLLALAFRHRLVLPGEVVMLLRLIVLSEGLGLALDPNFQLLTFAEPYLQQFWRRRRSLVPLAMQMAQGMLDATETALHLPRQISHLLGQLERETLRLNTSPDIPREFILQLHRMVNRLALSVILAATIVGMGLIIVAYHPPQWQPLGMWIVIVAFLISLILGVLLIWGIFRTGGQ